MASSSSLSVVKRKRWKLSISDIFSCLQSCRDRVSFSAVSSSCRQSATFTTPKHSPWLMLPRFPQRDMDRNLHSLSSERKLFRIHLPQIHRHRIVASGPGWIISMDPTDLEIRILDLVAGSTTPLPSFTTFSDVGRKLFNRHGKVTGYMVRTWDEDYPLSQIPPKFRSQTLQFMRTFYQKAFFFPSVSLVFVVYSEPYRLAFARIGDRSWTEFDVRCQCMWDAYRKLRQEGLIVEEEEEEEMMEDLLEHFFLRI